jgi:hypothetical protein
LRRPPEPQRASGIETRKTIRISEPAGVVVESDRPLFRWDGTTRAPVTVQVFDLAYTLVAESPRVDGSSWRPAAALARGKTYRWQLAIHHEDGDEMIPAPPDPPALFHVLGRDAFDELAAARNAQNALKAGLIAIREGLLDEGARSLARYAAEHPESPGAARLAERARFVLQSAPTTTNGAQ